MQELMWHVLEVISVQSSTCLFKWTLVDIWRSKHFLALFNHWESISFIAFVGDIRVVKSVVILVFSDILVVVDCTSYDVLVKQLVVFVVVPHCIFHLIIHFSFVNVVQINSFVVVIFQITILKSACWLSWSSKHRVHS